MARALLDRERPLGFLVSSQSEREASPLLQRIGLMNVCRVPMQKAVYRMDERTEFEKILAILNKLRINAKFVAHHNPYLTAVRSMMLADLETRMSKLAGHRCLIIPCGQLAIAYFQKVNIKGDWKCLHMPHPARNQWTKDNVDYLRSYLTERVRGFD